MKQSPGRPFVPASPQQLDRLLRLGSEVVGSQQPHDYSLRTFGKQQGWERSASLNLNDGQLPRALTFRLAIEDDMPAGLTLDGSVVTAALETTKRGRFVRHGDIGRISVLANHSFGEASLLTETTYALRSEAGWQNPTISARTIAETSPNGPYQQAFWEQITQRQRAIAIATPGVSVGEACGLLNLLQLMTIPDVTNADRY